MSEKEDLAKQEAPPEYKPSDTIPPAGPDIKPVQPVTRKFCTLYIMYTLEIERISTTS